MPETYATIDFSPIACTIAYAFGYALLGSDASQCRSDCIQVKLIAFCYGLGWLQAVDLSCLGLSDGSEPSIR